MTARAAVFALAALAAASPARAQAGGPGRIELAVGPTWIGGASMGQRAANETQSNGAPRALFTSTSDLGSAPGVEARVGVRLTRRVDVEAAGSYAPPDLRVAATADVEGAAPVTATERLLEFSIGAGAVWYARAAGSEARTIPFVAAGAGYIRQLHRGDTLADGGALFDVGGGVKQLLAVRSGRALKALGVRGDVRARVRPAALAIDHRAHASPMVAASLFVRF